MAGVEKVVEKVPGWVERLLIPTLESRVRTIVKEEVGHLEKMMNVRFEAVDPKFDVINSKFDAIGARIESLEKRIPMVQDIADLKARLEVVEKRTS
jgi:hypothetical protein